MLQFSRERVHCGVAGEVKTVVDFRLEVLHVHNTRRIRTCRLPYVIVHSCMAIAEASYAAGKSSNNASVNIVALHYKTHESVDHCKKPVISLREVADE